MKLFDSHCHLDDNVYAKDFDAVVARMADAGVAGVMIVGIDDETSQKAVAMASGRDMFWASVGVHPHNADGCSDGMLDGLCRLAGDPKVRAWGEIGLDFFHMRSSRRTQEHWFVRQLETAAGCDLPVILHERDSNGRLLEVFKAHAASGQSGVVHCFSGNRQELIAYLDLGLYIGVTGIVTLFERGRRLRSLVPIIPDDRLLIETDAPYLTPAPEKNRFRRNEPAFVSSVLGKLAKIRGQSVQALAEAIWTNTCRLYRIDASPPVSCAASDG